MARALIPYWIKNHTNTKLNIIYLLVDQELRILKEINFLDKKIYKTNNKLKDILIIRKI